MTKRQCLEVLAYLSAAIGKPAPSDQSGDIYFEMLGDLPLETLRIAAQRVILAHPWLTFPSIAELRQAASETILGQCQELTALEAWGHARRIAAAIDPSITGPYVRNGTEYPSQTAAHMAEVPLLVAKTIRAIGLHSIRHDNESVVRGHFLKSYDSIVAEHRKLALLPAALQRQIEARALTNQAVLKQIGRMP